MIIIIISALSIRSALIELSIPEEEEEGGELEKWLLRQISHPDEEDPGAICALLRAMKLNVWPSIPHQVFLHNSPS